MVKQKREGLFFFPLILTGFFLLLEISFFIQCNKIYLTDFSNVADKISIPLAILPGVFYFLFVEISIHLMYGLLIGSVTYLIANFFRLNSQACFRLSMGLWMLGILTILAANQIYFPNSHFSELTKFVLFYPSSVKIIFRILLFASCVALLLALFELLISSTVKTLGGLGFIFIIYFIDAYSFFPVTRYSVATPHRPNIILIGVDSLRPDFLGYFGRDLATPFFDKFLQQSTVFSEAITPLARTFPSWSAILTGQYPREIHIRSNLAEPDKTKLMNTLPAILKREGYETLFATDETRFSNIDQSFGFDQLISPPIGLNDFLIGTFNDFPLSNLLINTAMGKWLFPYSYANRPVFFSYDPDSFIHLLQPELRKQRKQPLFLAVHFCLTHYPYFWAYLSEKKYSYLERYRESVKRVDRQINDLFLLLQQAHLLDHAIVVLLSDHGEALELRGDRLTEQDLFLSESKEQTKIPQFYPPGPDKQGMNQSAGHGTDVLGLPQYHTLLAFRLYGMGHWRPGDISGIVSLLDIKPTLLQLIHIPSPDSSGDSLVDSIKEGRKRALFASKPIFLESDFTPEAIRTVYPEIHEALLEGIQIFQIDPSNTRLSVKPAMEKMIITSKQYANIEGQWILALYPQNKRYRTPILLNLNTGQWTNDLHSSLAKQAPVSEMLNNLKVFYGKELE